MATCDPTIAPTGANLLSLLIQPGEDTRLRLNEIEAVADALDSSMTGLSADSATVEDIDRHHSLVGAVIRLTRAAQSDLEAALRAAAGGAR